MGKAWILGAAAAAIAGGAQADELVLNGVVGRVVVTPENRPDMVVQVQPGRALGAPRVRREGARIIVEGGQEVRGCNMRGGDTEVRLRGGTRLRLSEAPLITVRAPLNVHVRTEKNGALAGQIGPTRNLHLASGGCAQWTVGDVAGALVLTQSGGSTARVGQAASARMVASGGGVINAGQVRALDASASGGGVVRVAGVTGPGAAGASGGGRVRVEGGRTGLLRANASGGGWVDYGGSADGLDATASGGGRVDVARVTGPVNRRRESGGGVVRIRN